MQGRVLVVDDEKAMVLALKGLLGKEGYHVETAGSGEEALRRIETGSFHVVITDLSMNGVGGMQVLEHAKRVDPDLAVVMITAYGSEKIAVQRSEEHTSELQSPCNLVCRLLLEKKKTTQHRYTIRPHIDQH